MRKLTYFVRAGVDGRIAGPEGVLDWLFEHREPAVAEFAETVNTVLMGTATYDYMLARGRESYPGMKNYVFTRTVRQKEHPAVTMVPTDPAPFVADLKAGDGKGLWLLGGGVIFRYLLQAGLVDEIVVLVYPVLLGSGVPLLAECDQVTDLRLEEVTDLDPGPVRLRYRVGESRPASSE